MNGKKLNYKKSTSSTIKLKKKLTNPAPPIEHYDLYHYIGKIMYAKRLNDQICTKWTNLEKILLPKARQKFGRPYPPKENLNEMGLMNMLNGTLVSFFT